MLDSFDGDWPRFWIHFAVGALAGAGVGALNSWFLEVTLYTVPICGAVFGLAAGLYGDRFWNWFREWLPWLA